MVALSELVKTKPARLSLSKDCLDKIFLYFYQKPTSTYVCGFCSINSYLKNMKKPLPLLLIVSSLLFLGFIALRFLGQPQLSPTEQVKIIHTENLMALSAEVAQLKESIIQNTSEKNIQTHFKKARLAYKKVEWLAEYYNPSTAKSINGAPIPEVEIYDGQIVVEPLGLQVLEEYLFPVYQKQHKEEVLTLLRALEASVTRLKSVWETTEITDSHVWDAMRYECWRMETLGLAGFDTPGCLNAMPEAKVVLETLQKMAEIYLKKSQNKEQRELLTKHFTKTIQYLDTHTDFLKFNVLDFLTDYLNPLTTQLHTTQATLAIPFFEKELRPLKAAAKTLFEKNAFNPNYYAPYHDNHLTQKRAELGEMLFYESKLSGDNQRNCATCHLPEKAFTDGLKTALAMDGRKKLARNTPTLLNAAFQRGLFYDLRVMFLEDQAKDVLTNPDEMHGDLKVAVTKLKNTANYPTLFAQAFAKDKEPLNEQNLKIALASYTRSLTSLDSRFDKYMRGDKTQLNTSEKKGFNIYMTKGKCGTCHFMPLFNGTVPPVFDNTEAEIIGVPEKPATKNAKLDADLGKYHVYKVDLHKHAFKTPTLRNIELTQPYMHNGVYDDLEQVIEFYNLGGGKGIGIDLPNQTLPEDKLDLTPQEQKDLIAFLKSLTDTRKEHKKNVP
jgi:cytochrome c peroxidase